MDTFSVAEIRDAGFAPQAFQNDPDLRFGIKFSAGLALDLTNNRFGRTFLFDIYIDLLAWFYYKKTIA
jgi:hypothetical protein